jgi:glutamine amidotransferase
LNSRKIVKEKTVAVIDYGLGNLRSVTKALEAIGVKPKLTNQPGAIARAEAVVLPGVGAFARGMENLTRLNITTAIREAIDKGKSFLGICLGLQLLFRESCEHGIHKGLGIIPGSVRKFPEEVKVPHMGWNQVKFKIKNEKLKIKIFNKIPNNSYFYFVHSYYVEPEDRKVIVATTEYGKEFASVINKDNVWGVQFHPEKSGDLGLMVLKNFISQC